MADFCSLCGYNDQNIKEIYDEYIKPIINEDIETLEDDYSINVNIGGVCEGCGLIALGINNKYEAHGTYYGEYEKHILGYVDKETFELIIDENNPKYEKQRMLNKLEEENFRKQMNEIEIKKDLYKSKNMAKFSHYVSGSLYYRVELADGIYQFPISTVENKVKFLELEYNDDFVLTDVTIIDENTYELDMNVTVLQLSEDLGQTSFEAEIKGSDLNRWISKAIKNDEFIKVG